MYVNNIITYAYMICVNMEVLCKIILYIVLHTYKYMCTICITYHATL